MNASDVRKLGLKNKFWLIARHRIYASRCTWKKLVSENILYRRSFSPDVLLTIPKHVDKK